MSDESKRENRAERTDAEKLTQRIEDELADHLASAASKLARDGAPPDDAARLALEKFGDVRRTARRCLWIHQGDQIMRRYVSIGLVVVFVLVAAGFVFPFVSKLRKGQQAMAEDIQIVATKLELIGSTQKKLLEQSQEAQVLEIKGRVYLGDPSKPGVGAEIQLLRLPSMEVYRRFQSKSDGTFSSGPLPPGDYALLAELVDENNWQPFLIQSEPLYIYSGVELLSVELDLSFRKGQVSLELSRPLPGNLNLREDESGLYCDLNLHIGSNLPKLPWSPSADHSTVLSWPSIGSGRHGETATFYSFISRNTLTSLVRLDSDAPDGRFINGKDSPLFSTQKTPAAYWPEGRYRVAIGLGLLLENGNRIFGGVQGFDFGREWTSFCDFDVSNGKQVNLKVEVPETFESRLRELMAKPNDEITKAQIEQVRSLLPTIKVVSTTSIPESPAEESTP